MAGQDVSNKFLKESKASKDRVKNGLNPYGGPYKDRNQGQIPDGIWVWMNDVGLWGKDVRRDIRDIERVLTAAQKTRLRELKARRGPVGKGRRGKRGDPGDPPPPPPDDNQ